MIKKPFNIFIIIIFLLMMNSCAKRQANNKFTSLVKKYIEDYFKFYPVKATLLGNHTYDNQMDNLGKDTISRRTKLLYEFQNQLNTIDSSLLTEQNKIDYSILQHQIKLETWELTSYRPLEKDASVYIDLLKNAIVGITSNDNISTVDKCKNLYSRLLQFPEIIQQAKENLQNPTRLSVERAIDQITSLNFLLIAEVTGLAQTCPQIQDSLLFYNKSVLDSLTRYSVYLKDKLLPFSIRESPIGEELYLQILKTRYQIQTTAVRMIAEIEKERLWCLQQIISIAKEIYKQQLSQENSVLIYDKEIIEKVLNEISNNYVQDHLLTNLVLDIIDDIKTFVEIKNLFDLSEDYSLKILRTPEWEDDQKLAYLQATGPLELKQNYKYYLKSVPNDLTWMEQISFLRNLNKTKLQVLTIQNVLPGKLLITSRRYRYPSLVRNIFPDESFTAGWPFYAGFIMIDAGYGGYDLKIKLIHLISYLQQVISAKVDLKYHTSQLTSNDALSILMNESYMSINQAEPVLKQIMLYPAQQIPSVWGYIQIRNIHDTCLSIEKNFFSNTEFCKRLLNEGSIPLTILKNRLLQNTNLRRN